jgi:hypothetical protein
MNNDSKQVGVIGLGAMKDRGRAANTCSPHDRGCNPGLGWTAQASFQQMPVGRLPQQLPMRERV